MTALKPLPDHDIRAVSDHDEERKLLRRQVLNPVCAHPDCDDKNVEGHHLFPRSFISNSSWYVRIPGVEKPVLHVTGLCRQHHTDVEEHRAWIKLEDSVWNWYDENNGRSTSYQDWVETPAWVLTGPLSPQPGEVAPARKKRKATTGTDRRKSKFVRFRVPDDTENGAGVISDLVQAGREQWASELGWGDDVGDYFVICAAFARAFQGG